MLSKNPRADKRTMLIQRRYIQIEWIYYSTLKISNMKTDISADFLFESKYLNVKGSNMHYIDQGEGDIEKTRIDLLEYCKRDTYAMVKILDVLYNV